MRAVLYLPSLHNGHKVAEGSRGTGSYLPAVWADIKDKKEVIEIVQVLVETSAMV